MKLKITDKLKMHFFLENLRREILGSIFQVFESLRNNFYRVLGAIVGRQLQLLGCSSLKKETRAVKKSLPLAQLTAFWN